MLEQLKEDVCRANRRLSAAGLTCGALGSVSGIGDERDYVVVKPAAVSHGELQPADMIVVSLATGDIVEGKGLPVSEAFAHCSLYQAFAEVCGIAQPHGGYMTAWAQVGKDIPAFGATHAEFFRGTIPCTRRLTPDEINTDYENSLGRAVVERFETLGLKPLEVPAALLAEHGAVTWGPNVNFAVTAAVMLEHVAELASKTVRIEAYPREIQKSLLEKRHHYTRGMTELGNQPPL